MLWSLVCVSALSDSLLIKGEQRTANPTTEGFKKSTPTYGAQHMVPSRFGHLHDRLVDIVDNDHMREQHNHGPRRQRARGA